jgi:hypothetical protein
MMTTGRRARADGAPPLPLPPRSDAFISDQSIAERIAAPAATQGGRPRRRRTAITPTVTRVIQVSSLERWTVHEPHEDLLVLVHALHEKRFEQVLEHELESVSGIYRGRLSDAGEAGGTCRSWRGRRPEAPAGPGGPCRDLALSWRLMRAKLIAEPGALPAITANERGWPRFKVVRGDEIIDVDVDL